MPPADRITALLDEARALGKRGDSTGAFDSIWRALDLAPREPEARALAAALLATAQDLLGAGDVPRLHSLVLDPAIDPQEVASASWTMLERLGLLPMPGEAGADWLEQNDFAQALLDQACVTRLAAERALAAVRRWLLLSGRSGAFPRSVAALAAQAAHNGGAWPFDAEERARLADADAAALVPAYLPARPHARATGDFASPVTRSVAGQYEAWPYPVWQRRTQRRAISLSERIATMGPGAPAIPDEAEILIAGCGTGSEPFFVARMAPRARITAIDLSAASLDYARERCAAAGIDNIRFEQHDLHDAAALGQAFDFIACGGVLHHLPDPEAGWAALVGTLAPGGVMRIAVYSKIARLFIRQAQAHIADLAEQPVDDDLLRAVRARLLRQPDLMVTQSADFFSMGGVHDLLLHRHEDPFDVPRIRRAIETLGLELLRFDLPGAKDRVRYCAEHPEDPWFRDYANWSRLEFANAGLFRSMYLFWCVKPAA